MFNYDCFAYTRKKGNFYCSALKADNCLNCKFYKTIEQFEEENKDSFAQERRKKHGTR